jgi:hypothetical protein
MGVKRLRTVEALRTNRKRTEEMKSKVEAPSHIRFSQGVEIKKDWISSSIFDLGMRDNLRP